MVPLTVVRTLLKSLPSSFAMPKSATLGTRLTSSRMFSGLMSQWMMQSRHPSWRYSKPRAAPSAIWNLARQLSAGDAVKSALSSEPLGMWS